PLQVVHSFDKLDLHTFQFFEINGELTFRRYLVIGMIVAEDTSLAPKYHTISTYYTKETKVEPEGFCSVITIRNTEIRPPCIIFPDLYDVVLVNKINVTERSSAGSNNIKESHLFSGFLAEHLPET